MPKVFFYALGACGGCEAVLLDCGEELLSLGEKIEFRIWPLFSACREDEEAEIVFVSGAVLHQAHEEALKRWRKRARFLVALGTCATHGGLPAFLNQWPIEERFKGVYLQGFREASAEEGLPHLKERVKALDEIVSVDVLLPGCPPKGGQILEVAQALWQGTIPALPRHSVCETCPYQRQGKGEVKELQRFLGPVEEGVPVEERRCFLEQGFLCLGPVTRAGCGGEEPPQCLKVGVPCRGCFGPVKDAGNPMLDMLNALVSNGVNWRSLKDRRLLLAFAGAHGRLRPARG